MTSQLQHRDRLGFADEREIDAFVETLARFERGELDADGWRAYRVARGAYGQRQDGVHMLRIKLPQGVATAAQLRALADVAERFGRGGGHLTTRQNLQLNFVRPGDLGPALRLLAAAGITTSGAGGNTVRNVVACPLAGVSSDELFDVTPYAEAFTRHFLRHPLGDSLPRKFKAAFEGCGEDHAGAAIQDVGFRARLRTEDGRVVRGFFVTVAGGTATLPTAGTPLFEFLPAAEVLALGEALVRVFHARGDRVNRQRNRLKYLVRSMGFDTFRSLVVKELETSRGDPRLRLSFDPEAPPEEGPTPRQAAPSGASNPSSLEFQAFADTNVVPQRQAGFSTVVVSLARGDASSVQLRDLAGLSEEFGDGTVRFTSTGNVLLRWVLHEVLPDLHARLSATGLGRNGAGTAANVVACPGAATCRLAVTRTREVATLVEQEVRQFGRQVLRSRLPVHLSGCPNGCSQHHVAAVGLQGAARKLGTRAVPQYLMLLGGFFTQTGAVFGRPAARIPARRAPEAVAALARLYLEQRREGEAAGPFFARAFDHARALLEPFARLGIEDATREDFIEPGAREEFRPTTLEGECAA